MDFAISADFFFPAALYSGSKAGYAFKRGDFGMGYYMDNAGSFISPMVRKISLDALISAGPTPTGSLPWDNGLTDCDGGEDPEDAGNLPPKCARKPRITVYDKAVTVNANCWNTMLQLLRGAEPDASVGLIAIQETHLDKARFDDARAQARTLGWDAFFSSATGSGVTASGGVALLARPGIMIKPIIANDVGVFIPWSHRCGWWLVSSSFVGGYIVIVLYMEVGIGLTAGNLDLLNDVLVALRALARPFMILADWNCIPKDLQDSGWVEAVGAKIIATEAATCVSPFSSRVLDFAVVSNHWHGCFEANLHTEWAPRPHIGVRLNLPCSQPHVHVEVIRRPRRWPAETPLGPEQSMITVRRILLFFRSRPRLMTSMMPCRDGIGMLRVFLRIDMAAIWMLRRLLRGGPL